MALIKQLKVSGYRSIRDLTLKLDRVNVIVGPNGCGKSNLYRALYLVAAAANGTLARTLADEGGLPSVFWAGKRYKFEKPRIKISIEMEDLGYELIFGRVPLGDRAGTGLEAFINDPDIKEENIDFYNDMNKTIPIVRRKRSMMSARNMDGRSIEYPLTVLESESVLSGLREPHKFPELYALRQQFLSWRFYHKFRTDSASPLREPQISVLTPVLSHDGADLPAALATINAIGDEERLKKTILDAFPGSSLLFTADSSGLRVAMNLPGINRPFEGSELSDGTLHYLCLVAALLSPRPSPFLVLNEPETSIHPDLFEPLARLIVQSSKTTQVWLTTHSNDLANYIKKGSNCNLIALEKIEGATKITGTTGCNTELNDAGKEGFWDFEESDGE